MKKLILLALLGCASCQPPAAFARDNGQYAQADEATRLWFRNQVSPKSGIQCCSEADGQEVEEDIRNGHYWIRVARTNGDWLQVPDDVVIHDANRNGQPVVWWIHDSLNHITAIRCYAPGSGA